MGWLRWSEKRLWRPRREVVRPGGVPLLSVTLSPGPPDRRLAQGAKRLKGQRVRRVLTAPGLGGPAGLETLGLAPVDPLPLCRAKAPDLAVALLEDIPPRERRVALRGDRADAAAQAVAEGLCPRVGALILDFPQGGEALAARLRKRWGLACLTPDQAPPPQVSLELSPRPSKWGLPVRLWGEPGLQGLTLAGPAPVPPDLPALPFLELLWETGRLSAKDVRVLRKDLDRSAEDTL